MIGSKGDLRSHGSWVQGCTGGFPERSKGSDCKSDGIAFAGSNPAPPIKSNTLKKTGGRHVLPQKNAYTTASKSFDTGEQSKRDQLSISFVGHVQSNVRFYLCGCSSMVEPQPSKLKTRVRFPSPALILVLNVANFTTSRLGLRWCVERIWRIENRKASGQGGRPYRQ